MKKIFCLVLLTLVSLSLLFAVDMNNQKVWSVDSSLYKAIRTLYLSSGYAEPSSSGPWSQDELVRMMEKIDPSTLSDELKEVYDYTENELSKDARFNTKDSFGANLRAVITPEVYLHTNKDDFASEKDWNYGFKDRKSILSLEGEAFLTRYIYLDVDFGIKIEYGKDPNDGSNKTYSSIFAMNIPMLFGMPDFNTPFRAVMAFGGDHFSFQLGRDRLSWGNGVSGNLMLGDNLPYHNFIKFDTHFSQFKFTFLVSFFPHPENYLDDNGNVLIYQTQNVPLKGVKAFIGHRFEFRFFHDKMALSLNESIMFQTLDSPMDMRVLNPVYLYHDLYMRGNANSLISLEYSYTIFKGFEAYLQVAVDDFVAPLENKPPENDSRISAFGYILGAKYTTPLLGGVLSTSLEGAYTDPFLYIREKYDKNNKTYGVNYDVVMRYARSTGSILYEKEYIGYKYGPDAIVVDLKAEYDKFDTFHLEGEFTFLSHGIIDYNSFYDTYGRNGKTDPRQTVPHTPSVKNPFVDDGTVEFGKDQVEYSFILSLSGEYKIISRLKVFGDITAILVLNKGNKEKSPSFDAQFALGASYTFD